MSQQPKRQVSGFRWTNLFVYILICFMAGVGQMQPSVTPMNAGILAGIYLTSIGIGAALISQIVSRVVDASGGSYAAGAWVATALMVLSLGTVWMAIKGGGRPKG